MNLVDDGIELHRAPDRASARYAELRPAAPGERIDVAAFADVALDVSDLLLVER